jgi:hypothetical protein
MENGVYEGRCGSCALYKIAALASLEDHQRRRIEGPTERGIRKDGCYMHAVDYERSGVICVFSDGKNGFAGAFSKKPIACQL